MKTSFKMEYRFLLPLVVTLLFGVQVLEPEYGWGEQQKALSYDELPNCSESRVRLIDVYDVTPSSDVLDIVFYSDQDVAQHQQSLGYKAGAVAYNPELLASPKTGMPDTLQVLARRAQIACLPTRFRFVYVGSRRYIEYREGSKAWE